MAKMTRNYYHKILEEREERKMTRIMTNEMAHVLSEDASVVKRGLEDIYRDVPMGAVFKASDVKRGDSPWSYTGNEMMALVNRGAIKVDHTEKYLIELDRTTDYKGRTIVTSVETSCNYYKVIRTYDEWKDELLSEIFSLLNPTF